MKKIHTLFVRDPLNMSRVMREVTPGCEWVLVGEGVPTRKRDGANVAVEISRIDVVQGGGNIVTGLYKRRNVTREERASGAEPGYAPVDLESSSDKWLVAAARGTFLSLGIDRTTFVNSNDWPIGLHPCEALGAKIQGGVEGPEYRLYPFDLRPEILYDPVEGRSFDSISQLLSILEIEGIVWHHPDGRRAKIKSRDFGLPWPVRKI